MQFFVVLNLVYSHLISICLCVSPEIWITETILHSMPKLFATNTTLISLHLRNFLFSFFFTLITLFLIVFGLVFSKLAAKGLLNSFAAAPPHFTAPFRLMRSTRPIEVFLLIELFGTIFTSLQIAVELSLSLDQPSNSLLQFISLFNQQLVLLFVTQCAVDQLFVFVLDNLQFLLKTRNLFFVLRHKDIFLLD